MKIVASKTKPPFASLVLAQLARLDTEWGAETCLEVKEGGICLKGDASIARYLAQSNPHLHLQGDNIQCKTEVDHWISFVIGPLACENEFEKAIQYLDQVLLTLTHLVGDRFTVADFVVFGGLYFNGFWQNLLQQGSAPTNVLRWFHLVASHEPVKAVLSTLPKESHVKPMSQVPKKEPARTGEPKKVKDEGKFVDLPGAEMGKVVVRFPPEASGYLHIGHAKAALLNQHYKDHFQGKLIMRFDDTNPAKEKEEYEHVILEDLKMLNVRYDYLSRTSDHFSTILNYCEKLLKEGKAYVDDTDADTMKKEREARQESKNRDNSVATNLSLWEEMKKGSAKGLTCAVRAKMDMKSDNGCMRDPTIYRCKLESHPATKEQFKVYPTYDFACPIVDSIEGVTHALRTTEYMDRDEQFYWFIDALGLRKPVIYAYARLNLTNTVMSKRKLTWFVESGTVDGWDDPRFPTVRGVLRRGLTVEALKQFILAQGSSRSVVFMKWDKIWAMNKKVLDPIAPRYTTIEEKDHVEVHIDGVAAEEAFLADAHPKDASVGKKVVWRTPRVLIDSVDAQTLKEGENATFINWGNITISKLHREHGKVVKVEAKANFDDKDFKKTLKVTWLGLTQAPEGQFIPAVCIYYDHIISKEVLDKEDDFKNFIGHNTKTEVAMLGDPELSKLKKGDIIQIQRRGFFIVDAAYKGPSVHSCKPSPIRLIAIPDGSSGSYGCPISQANSTATVSEPKPSLNTKGGDSKPSQSNKKAKCPSVTQDVATVAAANDKNSAQLHQEIVSVGNKVRELKASKADKAQISEQVAQLLHLKAQFKTVTGTEWKPEDAKPSAPPSSAASSEVPNAELSKQLADDITAQGNKVRQLKADKADKAAIDTAVHVLLGLKTKYKTLTGQDWQPPSDKGPSKKETKGQPKAEKKPQSSAQTKSQPTPKVKPEVADAGGLQKQTRLGMEARKEDNLADWYSQVITKAELLEYYDVSGCYILRPWAFSIWEKIQHFFDGEIKKLGVQNCYFPMFVSQAALQREKDHIADFAPEVAWVTKSGDSELAEPIAIRPTSETVMYPAYAKWVQSYRDLPIKLNQWNNVVRWEFKHPQPFLRTREFLWQEGHTAFANQQEAKEEVMIILDLYRQVYEDLLAIPVIRGRKTEKEKFAGGDYTTTVEAYISSAGRAIQGATSHHLGQNFSKMFEIVYDHPETGDKCYVYQNSWGITTRTLGVLTMVHGDNKGLVLPPNVAQIQVVIVACGITVQLKEQDKNELYSKCKEYEEALKAKSVRVMGDYRENYSPGWKFNHWELKGVPIRVEIGPRDIKSGQYVAVRRDTGEKLTMKKDSCQKDIPALLDSIQASLFNKAKEDLNKNLVVVKEWSDFLAALDQNKLIQAPFCGQVACEDQIKDMSKADADLEPGAPSMGAKSLCIPFSQPAQITPDLKCIGPRCQQSPQAYTLFGRSY